MSTPLPTPPGRLMASNTSRSDHTIAPCSAPWANVAARKVRARPLWFRNECSADLSALKVVWFRPSARMGHSQQQCLGTKEVGGRVDVHPGVRFDHVADRVGSI